MRDRRRVVALVVPLACVAAWGISRAGSAPGGDEPGRQEVPAADGAERPAGRGATAWTTAMEPRPLSRPVKRGLEWLVEGQLPGGGWGEGEVSRLVGPNTPSETPDVANTCIACLALIRSGSTPREGPYRGPIVQGVEYVCVQLEAFDPESLVDPNVQKTIVERKLGPYIDIYLACLLLAEVKGHMSSQASEAVVERTLNTVIGKIETRVMQDDPFGFPAWTRDLSVSVAKGAPMPPVPASLAGWEPILANAPCGKALNRARQAGTKVSDFGLAHVEDAARKAYRDLVGAMPHAEPSNWVRVWRFARERVQASFMQQVANGTLTPGVRRSPSMAADDTVPEPSRIKGRTATKGAKGRTTTKAHDDGRGGRPRSSDAAPGCSRGRDDDLEKWRSRALQPGGLAWPVYRTRSIRAGRQMPQGPRSGRPLPGSAGAGCGRKERRPDRRDGEASAGGPGGRRREAGPSGLSCRLRHDRRRGMPELHDHRREPGREGR